MDPRWCSAAASAPSSRSIAVRHPESIRAGHRLRAAAARPAAEAPARRGERGVRERAGGADGRRAVSGDASRADGRRQRHRQRGRGADRLAAACRELHVLPDARRPGGLALPPRPSRLAPLSHWLVPAAGSVRPTPGWTARRQRSPRRSAGTWSDSPVTMRDSSGIHSALPRAVATFLALLSS